MICTFVVCLLVLLQAVDSVTTQKQNSGVDAKGMPCNINNYNSFYAGPNKKLENIILEMNRKWTTSRKNSGIWQRKKTAPKVSRVY